jgi:hypothetical protein
MDGVDAENDVTGVWMEDVLRLLNLTRYKSTPNEINEALENAQDAVEKGEVTKWDATETSVAFYFTANRLGSDWKPLLINYLKESLTENGVNPDLLLLGYLLGKTLANGTPTIAGLEAKEAHCKGIYEKQVVTTVASMQAEESSEQSEKRDGKREEADVRLAAQKRELEEKVANVAARRQELEEEEARITARKGELEKEVERQKQIELLITEERKRQDEEARRLSEMENHLQWVATRQEYEAAELEGIAEKQGEKRRLLEQQDQRIDQASPEVDEQRSLMVAGITGSEQSQTDPLPSFQQRIESEEQKKGEEKNEENAEKE